MPEDPTITNFPGAPPPSPEADKTAEAKQWRRELEDIRAGLNEPLKLERVFANPLARALIKMGFKTWDAAKDHFDKPAPSPDIIQTREWHRDLSALLHSLKEHNSSRERYQAACRIQEAVAWLEADLDALEHPAPIENPS